MANIVISEIAKRPSGIAKDYDGLLVDDAKPFEALMMRCTDVAERVNRAGA